MERAAAPLRQMGARIVTTDGQPPVRIHGGQHLHGIECELAVPSAQVKSALLLAGLYADGATTVRERAVTRDHTERMLRAFGATVRSEHGRVTVTGGERLRGASIRVPGDISSATFFIVAATLAGEGAFLIRDVGLNPTRTGAIDILKLMGADIRISNARTVDRKSVV